MNHSHNVYANIPHNTTDQWNLRSYKVAYPYPTQKWKIPPHLFTISESPYYDISAHFYYMIW